MVLPFGHTQDINSAVLSPKNNVVLTSSDDNSVKIWDIDTGKELLSFNKHVKKVLSAKFNSAGDKVITASLDKTARIFEINSGREICVLSHPYSVRGAEFSSNGKKIITISGKRIYLWDAATGKRIKQFKCKNSLLKNVVSFSNNDKYIIATNDDNSVVLFDVDSIVEKTFQGHNDEVNSAFLNPNGDLLISSSNDKTVRIWDVQSEKEVTRLEAHQWEVNMAVFSSNSLFALSASEDHSAILWDSNKGEYINKFLFSTGIKWINFSHDEKFMAISSEDETRVYNTSTGNLLLSSHINQNIEDAFFISNEFSSDNKYLVISSNKYVEIWDIEENKLHRKLNGKACWVKSLKFSNDGKHVLTTSDNFEARINEVETGKLTHTMIGHSGQLESVNYSYDGKFVVSASKDSTARVWSAETGEQLHLLRGHQRGVYSALFSFDNNLIVTSSYDKETRIWDVRTGELIKKLKGHRGIVSYAEFSPDSKKVITASGDNTARLWEVPSGRLLKIFKGHEAWVTSAFFSPNGKYILTKSFDMTVRVYDVKSGKLLHIISNQDKKLSDRDLRNGLILSAKFDNYSRSIVTANADSTVKVYDILSGKNILTYNSHRDWVTSATIGKEGRLGLSSSFDKTARVFDLQSGKDLQVFNHNNSVHSAIFSPNEKYVFTISDDLKSILWDVESGNAIYFFIHLNENNNWLVKLPNSPYYMCSKDASKMLHYVTPSLKVIGFEQLDPVYNRPDIVLDSIGKYFGNKDKGMIDEYRKSWEKRIYRLGLDKEKLGKGEIAVPNAEIVGADAIAYENKEGKIEIKVTANDSKYPLSRFNVYINEVPLYGSAGISIAHLKKQVWDTTVSVLLSVGENKIQVSVMNELGLENFKYPTYVNFTPEKEIVAKTHYIGIGVNAFQDSSHNLKYCVKDITDLAKSFGGANTEVKLFSDKQVTKENILALKDYLNKTSVNDKVIISCSSHGLLDDSLNFYLAMHDVDFNNPKARGLKYEELESLLDGIPARQKLLLLDACNSGENDKTEVLKKELQQKEKNMDSTQVLAARGVIIKLEEENKSNFKKMNELFVNVRNNTGSVIISAAGGQESALEAIKVDGKTIENGAFTYSILECLKQNEGKELKVNALKQYAEKRVEEITNGKQKPTSRQETMEVDWGVK
jgi:WD40 repeat protein